MIHDTLYAIADCLQVPFTPTLKASKPEQYTMEKVSGGIVWPMVVESVVVSHAKEMSAVLARLRGDLWGYFVAIERPKAAGLRIVMVLFNGSGETFASLIKQDLVKTYEVIRPLKVAHYEFDQKKEAWLPHDDQVRKTEPS